MSENDYQSDLHIDPDSLDLEWLRQPQIFMEYAEKASNARADLDRAKENLDVVKAELDRDIRRNPGVFNLEKITEPVVASTIILQREYSEAMEGFVNSKHECDMLMNAVKAFDQRKVALENLVRLHGQQYFAGPREPRDLSRENISEMKHKEASAKINSSLNKNRKSKRTK